MKVTKQERLEKKLKRALKNNNRRIIAWTLIEIDRLEISQSVETVKAEETLITKSKINPEQNIKGVSVNSLPANVIVKKFITNTHITATERRAIREGLKLGLTAFSTRCKYYEVIDIGNDILTMKLFNTHLDGWGRKMTTSQKFQVTFNC